MPIYCSWLLILPSSFMNLLQTSRMNIWNNWLRSFPSVRLYYNCVKTSSNHVKFLLDFLGHQVHCESNWEGDDIMRDRASRKSWGEKKWVLSFKLSSKASWRNFLHLALLWGQTIMALSYSHARNGLSMPPLHIHKNGNFDATKLRLLDT